MSKNSEPFFQRGVTNVFYALPQVNNVLYNTAVETFIVSPRESLVNMTISDVSVTFILDLLQCLLMFLSMITISFGYEILVQ